MTQPVLNDTQKLRYGSFYMGQTREEVVKNKGDVSLFDKIDKLDGSVTGTLSESDLLIYRDDAADKSQTFGYLALAGAAIAGFIGGPVGWAMCGINACFAAYGIRGAESINNNTDRYLNNLE